MIRLVCLDLDGTTLNSQHQLSDKTTTTLRRLSKLGITIALVTGRSKPTTTGYAEILNLSHSVPIICYNGSMGFMSSNEDSILVHKQIFSTPITEQPARILLKLAEKLGLVAQYYNGDTGDVYAVPLTDEHQVHLDRYASLVGKKQLIVASYEEAIQKSPSAKMLVFTSDVDQLMEVAEKELPKDTFHMIRGSPYPFFVEFLLPGINKGSALKLLCEHLNIPIAESVAFGDGENDQEMLAAAGVGCAMKNARPAAKEAANVVLEWTNDDNGVALQLERMESEGQLFLQK